MRRTRYRNNPTPLLALAAQSATVNGAAVSLIFSAAVNGAPADVWTDGSTRCKFNTRLTFDSRGRLLTAEPVSVRREVAELLATLGLQFDAQPVVDNPLIT